MGGGLMQLVAYGAQDIYLTGNPQITFFKVVYRRHTNFSMEAIQQTLDGTADFDSSVSCTISRNGDLVYRMYLEHEASLIANAASDDDNIGIGCDYGSHLMKQMDLEIGGQLIDRHYGHWHSAYSQLTEFNPSGAAFGGTVGTTFGDDAVTQGTLYKKMSVNGNSTESKDTPAALFTSMGGWTMDSKNTGSADEASGKFWIPLYFWFCRNPGLALPLIALQYHEVKVKIVFESLIKLTVLANDATFMDGGGGAPNKNPNGTNSFNLWCDYIYLDTDERRRFAQVSHEYLIEQVQHQSSSGGNIDLNFNHPVKEIIWAGVRITTVSEAPRLYEKADLFNASTDTVKLTLNGHDRFAPRNIKYFTRTQVWQHHTGYGSTQTDGDEIAVYSFALKPEEHQPSGTCNFSRIDNAQLVQSAAKSVEVYAVNYNVLRIMSGMGGLAYSN